MTLQTEPTTAVDLSPLVALILVSTLASFLFITLRCLNVYVINPRQ